MTFEFFFLEDIVWFFSWCPYRKTTLRTKPTVRQQYDTNHHVFTSVGAASCDFAR
eukprot:m.7750 g.7750  ORF g.7750 m.7750 type:complete len:55 (-) comp6180_c0_seq1:18-182(-)